MKYSDILIDFADNTDLLIHDAQYTNEEYYSSRIGWGHSPLNEAIRVAREAKVKRLAFFHHDPSYDDEKLSGLERQLNSDVVNNGDLEVFFATEGSDIQL